MIEEAERIKNLPTYLFVEIDRMKEKEGKDLIDLGVGDPDKPTPVHIIQAMKDALGEKENHRYPSYEGLLRFREAVAGWYKERFGVKLDPETEVLTLIGAKEGIGHLPLAFINPGDVVLTPNPGYPVYQAGTILASGEPYMLPLLKGNDFLPDLDSIPESILKRTKILFLNYPNNPTGAVCPVEFFRHVVRFAERHNIVICHDATYSEITYDGYRAPSFLQVEGGKDVGVEFHSLSKTFNMTGWRIGFAVGNKEIISLLGKVKSNLDSGVFRAIQYAGITALASDKTCVKEMQVVYKERRDILVDGLDDIGWRVVKPKATFYVWIPIPPKYTSIEFTKTLLRHCGIVTTPGIGFGKYGEGYIRIALTVDKERLKEAVERIKGLQL
ncbi:MAG: LL-diaminopimelate aminotransferase [bacterium]|nr:LL-diaminopimelate aminotransferase [bacterium]